jgi:hypothetical protein
MMLTCTVGPDPSHLAVYSPAGIVVPFTCVAAEISKLLLCESLAAKALVVNANASVANMILENNVDFITAPYNSFPQFGGNRFGAAFSISDELCNSSPMTYNSTRGLRNRRAYACRFLGTVLAWGRQNRGREQSLNPVNPTCCFQLSSYSFFSTCKDDAKQQKVSTNLVKYCS